MTIYSSGIRLNELLSLKINNIDFDRNLMIIKQGKGKKDRQRLETTQIYTHISTIAFERIKSPLDRLKVK